MRILRDPETPDGLRTLHLAANVEPAVPRVPLRPERSAAVRILVD